MHPLIQHTLHLINDLRNYHYFEMTTRNDRLRINIRGYSIVAIIVKNEKINITYYVPTKNNPFPKKAITLQIDLRKPIESELAEETISSTLQIIDEYITNVLLPITVSEND